jgi:hypothetical protein
MIGNQQPSDRRVIFRTFLSGEQPQPNPEQARGQLQRVIHIEAGDCGAAACRCPLQLARFDMDAEMLRKLEASIAAFIANVEEYGRKAPSRESVDEE